MFGTILFKRDKEVATPLLLKIGVVLIGWPYVVGLTKHLDLGHRAVMHAAPLRWSLGVAINVVGIALAVALWNLKRWAFFGLVMLAFVNLALGIGVATHLSWVAAIRFVPLIPAVVYWKRLTPART